MPYHTITPKASKKLAQHIKKLQRKLVARPMLAKQWLNKLLKEVKDVH